MRVDLLEHHRPITTAALQQMLGFQQNPTGKDRTHPSVTFDNVLKGKLGEAAWALKLGFGLDAILDDGPNRPDFVDPEGRSLDVKCAKLDQRWINVRSYYLKDAFADWTILAALCDVPTFTVELVGSLPASRLWEYPVSRPASGHSTEYISVPTDAFDTAGLT